MHVNVHTCGVNGDVKHTTRELFGWHIRGIRLLQRRRGSAAVDVSAVDKEIFEILWVKGNIKSYKKYFYTMQSYPDCICITVDDDIIYQRNTIANLLNCYKKNPTSISALCTNKLLVKKGEILNYSNAIQCYDNEICIPRFDLVAIGFAGILYPPSILPQESFNLKLIHKCAPLADDLWLKFTELLNHTPVACAARCLGRGPNCRHPRTRWL